MDDSQSSDFLSSSMDFACGSPEHMNTVPYDTLLLRTKKSIDESINAGITKSSLTHFNIILEDCNSCITQSLDLIIGLLVDSEVPYRMLTEYMVQAVSLLQMLSNYINTIVESVAVTCCSVKSFPVTTGNIVMAVFSHCKDSETLYGSHLKHVEQQLKDLFKSCHELQTSYLTVLEKHFTFDLSDTEEQEIFRKALDINLAIGEIVQTLDVKTMAEQWKAYTNICDKYSSFLSEGTIFEDCTKVICNMTVNNIRTALEVNQEDKIVLRSMKIASFTIKILLKLCGIFQCSSGKNYTNVLELLIFVKKHNCSHLELELKKSIQFINQITAIVIQPADLLLSELVSDAGFLQSCAQCSADASRRQEDMLGCVVVLTSVIERMLRKSDQMLFKFKFKIIKCIFDILPKCHNCLSLGLKFASKSQQGTHGLYEHILIHTIALASTLSSEDYMLLEEMMYGMVLGTECWSALLASDLWVALSRNNRQLLIEQLVFLCKTYEKLENNKLFDCSPQKVHLTHTIARLFDAMKDEDKARLYNRYNLALWTPVQIKHTPFEVQEKAIEYYINQLLTKFERVVSSDVCEDEVREMSKLMKAVATCSFTDETFEDYVIKVWMKSCPKNRIMLSRGEMDKSSLWYLEHVEALVALTKTMKSLFKDKGALTKILHVVCNIVKLGNTELCFILLDLLCLISLEIGDENNKNQLDSIVAQTYKSIFKTTDHIIYVTLFRVLKSYRNHTNYEYVVSLIFSLDNTLQETHGCFLKDTSNFEIWRGNLTSTEYSYAHRCVPTANVAVFSSSGSSAEFKENSNNFDFADIDSLFEGGSDSEPASKKAKLTNESKTEEIISRLEKDSSLLCGEKENVFSKEDISRIQAVCDRLKNIIY